MATTQDTPTETPSWRDREPAIVHSIKWRDGDGHEHLHIVRGDTLDEVLLHLKNVKATVAAARAREPQRPADNGASPAPATPRCPLHQRDMRPSKWGGWHCPTKMENGTYCPNKIKAG